MGYILAQLKNITFIRKLYYLILLLFIKLLLVVGALAWVAWLGQQEVNRERAVQQLHEATWDVVAQLHALNGTVHQYILHRKDPDWRWIEQNMPTLLSAFDRLRQHPLFVHLESGSLLERVHRYSEQVHMLSQHMETIGLTEEQGLQGEMRQAAHRVEHLLEPNPEWNLQMLQIRRAEKDFMLRLEPRYLETLHTLFADLLNKLNRSTDPNRQELDLGLQLYQARFQLLATLTLTLQDEMRSIYALWRGISDGIFSLRASMQRLQEQESRRYEQARHRLLVALGVGIILLLLLTGVLLAAIFYGNILKPIRQLTERAYAIAHGAYEQDISLSGRDEIGVLASHLQKMKEFLQHANRTLEQQVAERTQSLLQANIGFQNSMEQLEKTRDDLVQSEKMASLGRLVAGFAHELNTPIGISLGSVSAMPEYMDRLERLLAADEVDGHALDTVFAKLREMSTLCLKNLCLAADLVARFKRSAVDQTSERPRPFHVHEWLWDVIATVQHLFKRAGVEILVDCPDHIVVQSQPGALGQVLTNLLMNSFKHGFAQGQRPGSVQINVQYETERDKLLVIWYADTGRGMPPEVLNRIFEPFFTTAQGQGGSGLGLYICYNIVRSQLMGRMVCTSIPDQMTSFLIEIPVNKEGDEQENSP
ncbi:MAG: ATP-binding protein [Magnetococcus sp. MYC-9]